LAVFSTSTYITHMKNDSGARTETPDDVVDHISRLMNEAEALMVGPVSEKTKDRISELRARFDELQAKAGVVYEDARKKVIQGAKATDETIRAHPYESLAVALGIGVLIGALIRRSNH
jgi:Uncharacterized conserved protein